MQALWDSCLTEIVKSRESECSLAPITDATRSPGHLQEVILPKLEKDLLKKKKGNFSTHRSQDRREPKGRSSFKGTEKTQTCEGFITG